MATIEKSLKAYRFLMDLCESKSTFRVAELMQATGWAESTVSTYMSKQYRDFLTKESPGIFSVRPEFLRVSEERFLELVTQRRQVFGVYQRARYAEIVTYEFLLPLTREDQLRKALDALFYKDTILQRLSEIGLPRLNGWFPQKSGEPDVEYLDRVCEFVSETFGGYSISYVSGRFRAASLQTREDAARMLTADERYIIDETTASVRFIIPIKATKITEEAEIDVIAFDWEELDEDVVEEMSRVHSLFFEIFVEAVVRMIRGEDEIWLVEEAGRSRSLFVWEQHS